MEPICFAPTFSPRKYTEIAANARLIAAAPELLEFISSFAESSPSDCDDEAAFIFGMQKAARKLLAKVKAAK